MYQYFINEIHRSHSGSKQKIVSINKYDKLYVHKLNFIKSCMYIMKDEYNKPTFIYLRSHICSTWLLYNLVNNHLAMGSTSISSVFMYLMITSQFLIWFWQLKFYINMFAIAPTLIILWKNIAVELSQYIFKGLFYKNNNF